MVLGRLVEGRRVDLALDGPAHVRHLFGPLADERHHQKRLRVVLDDPVRDVLEHRRLARLGGRQDQAALAFADRRNEVDEALGEVLLVGLDVEHLVGEDRDQRIEVRPALGGLGVDRVDRVDAKQAPVLLLVLGRTGLAGHPVPGPQAEAANLGGADVDVVGRRHDAVTAQEPEALIDDLQDPLRDAGLPILVEARASGRQRHRVEQLEDEVLVLQLLSALDPVLGRELAQLVDRLGLQFGQ